MRGAPLVRFGAGVVVAAVIGWLVTSVTVSHSANPTTTEDLTAAWKQAGATPLGSTATATVPAGSTLTAFLVGTDLYGIAGTTTGSCTAESPDTAVELGSPVHINRSLTGVLRERQETVAIAGWTNDSGKPANVRIRCVSSDSTVEHFVAVPTRTAVVQTDPWFQPWIWVGLGALGTALILVGLRRG